MAAADGVDWCKLVLRLFQRATGGRAICCFLRCQSTAFINHNLRCLFHRCARVYVCVKKRAPFGKDQSSTTTESRSEMRLARSDVEFLFVMV